MNLGIVLLAAGNASRMGSLKQLLVLEGEPLLYRACKTALQTNLRPVTVVLGCQAAECEAVIAGTGCEIVVNADWETGMGSSLRLGMEALLKRSDVDGVLVLLHDQVLLSPGHLKKLAEVWEASGAAIVAAQYGDTVGTPAIFSKVLFPELTSLPNGAGAKKLIIKHAQELKMVDIPEAAFDIDTPLDYKEALARLAGRSAG